MWNPDLSRYDGPRYVVIVEAIAADIERGQLKPGDQMPTHRDLANHPGITTGTEDDVHSFMLPNPPPPLSSFAPRHSYYILSTSKSIAGGMRVGCLHAPERMIEPLATSLRATVWMAASLMAEIASEWIKDGTAERLVEQKRAEALARQEIARRTLAGFEFDAHPLSFHLWLHLPEPWRSNEFTA
jgi:DNA-binding transcriptional MocR family regulator